MDNESAGSAPGDMDQMKVGGNEVDENYSPFKPPNEE